MNARPGGVSRCLALPLLVALAAACSGCIRSRATDAERALLVTARDLELLGLSVGSFETAETVEVRTWLTGEREIKYTYDSPDDPELDPLFLVFRVELESSQADAASTFRQSVIAYRAGAGIKGARIREEPAPLGYGDESFVGSMEKDGEAIGTVVAVRVGTRIVSLLTGGYRFESREDLRAILEPRLALITAFR